MLASLTALVANATMSFDTYDYARALDSTERFFWGFCDDYLELVKGRAYGSQGDDAAASANRTLTAALSTLLRLFAPFLPYVTDEVWSWWQEGSIHRAAWPDADELLQHAGAGDADVLAAAAEVLGQVRRAKTDAKRSMKAPVSRVVDTAPEDTLAALRAAQGDLQDAGGIEHLDLQPGEELAVTVDLA
jgi:valyl-tRNA synthetase